MWHESRFASRFDSGSQDYARFRPTYPRELVDLLASHAPVAGVAVDCGCGTGQLALALTDRFRQVYALDVSSSQVSTAPTHPRIVYSIGSAEKTGLPEGSADVIVAAQAAHWFDLPRFWDEVQRIAGPGALVALVAYGLVRVDPAVDSLVEDFHDRVLGDYWPPERALALDGYSTVKIPFDELSSPSMDIRVQWSLDEFLGYLSTWSALRDLAQAEGQDAFRAFGEQLAKAWGNKSERRLVRWPLFTRLARISSKSSQRSM